MRRAHRVDENQADILRAFGRLGCSVLDMSGLGNGAPDAAIGFGGLVAFVEIKNPLQPPSKQKLTDRERKFKERWTGGLYLIRNLADVAQCVATLRRWSEILQASAQDRPLYHPLTAGDQSPVQSGRKP